MMLRRKLRRSNSSHMKKPKVLKCHLCGCIINGKATKDHITPRDKNGTNSSENLAWTHKECNSLKSNNIISNYKIIRPIFKEFYSHIKDDTDRSRRSIIFHTYRTLLIDTGVVK